MLSILDSRRDEVDLSTMHAVADRATVPEGRAVADAEVGEP
jgi:hypothetical protein